VWYVAPRRRDEIGLSAGRDLVDDVHVEAALAADQRGEEADGPRTEDERGLRLEPRDCRSRSPAPGLRDDGRWLEQRSVAPRVGSSLTSASGFAR